MVSVPDRRGNLALIAIARRVLEGLVTAWAAVTLAFFALRLAAGDPVASLLAQGLATPAQAEALRRSLGFDHPLILQYLSYLSGILRGDWGSSLYTRQPVGLLIGDQLAPTLRLGLGSLLVALLLGLLLGVLAAWRAGSPEGGLAGLLSGLATGLPVATTGVLALLLVSLIQRSSDSALPLSEVGRSLLPALVLGYAASGPFARAIHSGLEQSLKSRYILAARARGLTGSARLLWHALRPALPPAVSLIGLEAAFLFSGTVVTETVFSRPGLGRLLVRSILQGDFPVVQGIVVLSAGFYLASQVLADSVAVAIDPRLRSAG